MGTGTGTGTFTTQCFFKKSSRGTGTKIHFIIKFYRSRVFKNRTMSICFTFMRHETSWKLNN